MIYLLFNRRHCSRIVGEFWIFFQSVVVHPLAKMVGYVKPSIVVRTIFKIDNDQFFLRRESRLADQYVTLLQILYKTEFKILKKLPCEK